MKIFVTVIIVLGVSIGAYFYLNKPKPVEVAKPQQPQHEYVAGMMISALQNKFEGDCTGLRIVLNKQNNNAEKIKKLSTSKMANEFGSILCETLSGCSICKPVVVIEQ